MYIDENDNRTPRERIDDSFLRRMLSGSACEPTRTVTDGGNNCAARDGYPCNPSASAETRRLMNFPLGMVYSPIQEWRNAYDVETALDRGTLFRELDMPWEVPAPTGKGGCRCD